MNHFERAVLLCHDQKFSEALPLLEGLAGNDPKDPNILYNLGMCYTELDKVEEAIRTLSYCVKIAPTFSNAFVALGFAYSKKSDNELAISNFNRALELDANNQHALRNLGGLYAKNQDYDRAIEILEKAYKIDPQDSAILWNLAHTYKSNGNFEKASELLDQLINLDVSPFSSMAKTLKSEIAQILFKSQGLRMDAVFYCLAALKLLDSKKPAEVREITFEIGMLGRKGFDTTDLARKYTLSSLSGEFTGLQLVCYMYVGFKFIDNTLNVGFDLKDEYNMALELWDLEKRNES